MKISIYLEAFEPEFWGGREKRWSKLIPEIAKEHEVVIFADFTRVQPTVAFPNIQCSFVDIGPLPLMYSAKGVRSLRHAFNYTWQSRKLLSYEADVILTDQTPLISIPILRFISFLLKCELSVTWHEIWSIETWKKYSKINGFLGVILQTVAILTSKNIVVPSAQVLRNLENKIFSKRGVVIPNGIELHTKAMFKTEMLTTPSSVSLLYVGRLIKHKNCEFLLQIMALSVSEGRDWSLTIVGAGPLAEKLEFEIKKLELEHRVKIESNISNFDLDTHYKNCDVFLFPSEREGFGISVSEALSRNVPVIVYDVPENAAKDLISADVLSCKIDSLNAKIWVQATVDILNGKSTEKSESVFSELHTWESVGVQYSNYLKTLICNSSLGD